MITDMQNLLQAEINALKAERQNLESVRRDMQDQVRSIEGEKATLEEHLRSSQALLMQLERDLANASSSILTDRGRVEVEVGAFCESVRGTMAELRCRLDADVAGLRTRTEGELAGLREFIVEESTSLRTQLETEVESVRSNFDAAVQSVARNTQVYSECMDALQLELAAIRERREVLQSEVSSLQLQLADEVRTSLCLLLSPPSRSFRVCSCQPLTTATHTRTQVNSLRTQRTLTEAQVVTIRSLLSSIEERRLRLEAEVSSIET